jgi:ribosomal protein L7Ae-like RNA K-turn-binding protein
VDEATRRKVLGLLGLGVRGRLAIVGVERVREAAKRGKLALAVVAMDASRHSIEKVVPILKAKRIAMVEWPAASELGAAVGRQSTTAVGVVDWQLAKGVKALVANSPDRGEKLGSSRAP